MSKQWRVEEVSGPGRFALIRPDGEVHLRSAWCRPLDELADMLNEAITLCARVAELEMAQQQWNAEEAARKEPAPPLGGAP